ncbi:hypothetical protein ACTXT7_006651 [Hymenolepis weldensis]
MKSLHYFKVLLKLGGGTDPVFTAGVRSVKLLIFRIAEDALIGVCFEHFSIIENRSKGREL